MIIFIELWFVHECVVGYRRGIWVSSSLGILSQFPSGTLKEYLYREEGSYIVSSYLFFW